ncbi:hypothetical protein G7046_g6298 [Stylonectria norvegica]|nr:hypothetical protein G7046_g6298 [Stylonectria norvegica]
MPSLLEALRQTSQVDCDTLDRDVAEELGPFLDCTSNQAIAYFELARPVDGKTLLHHDALIAGAIQDAQTTLKGLRGSTTLEEFVVEILMVKLQLGIIGNLRGYIHIQTNPKSSYSTASTVDNAERIIAIVKALAPQLDYKRVCVKIPATWEGLQACRILEERGIATLATTMFCMVQAVLAADAKCTYIAPYVNELRVHFEPGAVDEHKAFDICREAQSYYLTHSYRTQVLAASLTSIDDVMRLAGIQHITISPSLLHQLSTGDLSTWDGKLGDYFAQGPEKKSWESQDYEALVKNESAWRLAFTRSDLGVSEGKIIQAINYFSDFQEKLEELVKQFLD